VWFIFFACQKAGNYALNESKIAATKIPAKKWQRSSVDRRLWMNRCAETITIPPPLKPTWVLSRTVSRYLFNPKPNSETWSQLSGAETTCTSSLECSIDGIRWCIKQQEDLRRKLRRAAVQENDENEEDYSISVDHDMIEKMVQAGHSIDIIRSACANLVNRCDVAQQDIREFVEAATDSDSDAIDRVLRMRERCMLAA
jgi:hypothetical protein